MSVIPLTKEQFKAEADAQVSKWEQELIKDVNSIICERALRLRKGDNIILIPGKGKSNAVEGILLGAINSIPAWYYQPTAKMVPLLQRNYPYLGFVPRNEDDNFKEIRMWATEI